jgi:hypothetical protein
LVLIRLNNLKTTNRACFRKSGWGIIGDYFGNSFSVALVLAAVQGRFISCSAAV